MNLDELRSVRRTERQKDSLQHLRDSFYEDVADYIAAQKAERQRAADAADDPFSDPEVGRLTDEIETAEDVVEAIYERRVGKVVKLASFAAADMSADTNGLTAEERDLFDDLVSRIKQNRDTVLDVLAGKRAGSETTTDVATRADTADADGAETPPPAGTTPAEEPTDDTPPPPPDMDPDAPADDPGDVLTDAMGGDGATDGDGATGSTDDRAGDRSSASDAAAATADQSDADRPTTEATAVAGGESPVDGGSDGESPDDGTTGTADDTERVTLRITQDVGQILGVDDREYDLETEDVVTLPTTNADPLVERGAAERLD
jgi:DNA replication factor GINS